MDVINGIVKAGVDISRGFSVIVEPSTREASLKSRCRRHLKKENYQFKPVRD